MQLDGQFALFPAAVECPVQISANYKKVFLKLFVLPLALIWEILPAVKKITALIGMCKCMVYCQRFWMWYWYWDVFYLFH